MATKRIQDLENVEEVLADSLIPVGEATKTKSMLISQLKNWLDEFFINKIGVETIYGEKTFNGGLFSTTPQVGDKSTKVATTDWVAESINASAPTGSIIAFGSSTAPLGFLPCNGAAINRITYSNLFEKIGITWGAGDGSTTFNLPNFTDRFLEGGGVVGQLIGAGLPNIVGQVNIPNGIYQAGATYFATSGSLIFRSGATQRGNAGQQGAGGRIEINASASSAIYGASATVQPNAARVLFCIKY